MVCDGDERAGRNALGGNNVGAIHPDVAVLKAGSAASGNFHRREIGGVCGNPSGHGEILNRELFLKDGTRSPHSGDALENLV
jgi:hypothetical protein